MVGRDYRAVGVGWSERGGSDRTEGCMVFMVRVGKLRSRQAPPRPCRAWLPGRTWDEGEDVFSSSVGGCLAMSHPEPNMGHSVVRFTNDCRYLVGTGVRDCPITDGFRS